jgi:hypothetical protein
MKMDDHLIFEALNKVKESTSNTINKDMSGKDFVPDYRNGPIQQWENNKSDYLGNPGEKLPYLTNLITNNMRNIESYINSVKTNPVKTQTDVGVKIAHMIYTLTWNAAFALQHAYGLAINGEKSEAAGQLGPKLTPDNTATTPTTQNLK